jgi:hypothetical protein
VRKRISKLCAKKTARVWDREEEEETLFQKARKASDLLGDLLPGRDEFFSHVKTCHVLQMKK